MPTDYHRWKGKNIRRHMMVRGYCPECDDDVGFKEKPIIGYRKICPNCGAHLVVIGLNPIELDWEFEDDRIRFGEEEFDY
jgi:hypothetical protein